MKYRELLPVMERKIHDDNNGDSITGLYFKHYLVVLRVFMVCGSCVGLSMVIALTRADASTGFTIAAFILAVPALFVAVLALTIAAR